MVDARRPRHVGPGARRRPPRRAGDVLARGDAATRDRRLRARADAGHPPRRAAGRPQRLDARLPGRPPRRPGQRHRGGRCSPTRPPASTRATSPSRSSRATPTPRTPGRLRGARPSPSRRRRSGVPGLWFWGNTAYDVRWHNDGVELRAMARGNVVTDRFELVARDAGRRPGLPPRRAARRRTPSGRVGQPPRVRDVRLHPHALRPRGRDPGRPPPLTASCAHTPCDTLDMLKSGIRRAGVAVREK